MGLSDHGFERPGDIPLLVPDRGYHRIHRQSVFHTSTILPPFLNAYCTPWSQSYDPVSFAVKRASSSDELTGIRCRKNLSCEAEAVPIIVVTPQVYLLCSRHCRINKIRRFSVSGKANGYEKDWTVIPRWSSIITLERAISFARTARGSILRFLWVSVWEPNAMPFCAISITFCQVRCSCPRNRMVRSVIKLTGRKTVAGAPCRSNKGNAFSYVSSRPSSNVMTTFPPVSVPL